MSTKRSAMKMVAGVGAGMALAVGAGAGMVAVAAARAVVIPRKGPKANDVHIRHVLLDQVVLTANAQTTAPGRYGLWLPDGGHARIGEVLEIDQPNGTVTRRLMATDGGELLPGPARWNQYFFAGEPSAMGMPMRQVEVAGDCGVLPAWVVPGRKPIDPTDKPASGSEPARMKTWAVLVHGRGATREECLRALPVLNRLGYTSMVVSYRNDAQVSDYTVSGGYHLGLTEARDVRCAVHYALDHGADDVVVVGWSMGAAIALHVAAGEVGANIRALVLDAPALDWHEIVASQAQRYHMPAAVVQASQHLMAHTAGHRLVGLAEPVSPTLTNWVQRAEQLRHPVLVIHSDADQLIPSRSSHALAAARPDLVHVDSDWPGAGHTREWNVDPARWDSAVARFLLST